MSDIWNLIKLRASNLNIINRANEFYFGFYFIRFAVIEHDRFIVLTTIELCSKVSLNETN